MRALPGLLLICSLTVHGQWSMLYDLPAAARDDAAAFAIGSDIYVGTGMDLGFQLTTDWHRYSTWDLQWHPAPALPATGRQYASTFVLGPYGYLFGGVDTNGALKQLWRFDPLLGQWLQRADLPVAARAAAASFTLNGLGYVCGGQLNGGATTDQLWAYDPLTNVWVARAPIPVARHRASAFTHDGKAYVVGGADAQFTALSDAWCYDPAMNAWNAVADMPAPRFGSDATEVLEGGVLIGGASTTSDVHDNVWTYHAATDTWQVLPVFPVGGRRSGCIAGWGGVQVYYGTGSDNTQRYTDWYVLEVPVGLEDHGRTTAPTVSPNPFTEHVRIDPSDLPASTEVTVLDAAGRVVHRGVMPGDGLLHLGMLGPGRYIARLQGNGLVRQVALVRSP